MCTTTSIHHLPYFVRLWPWLSLTAGVLRYVMYFRFCGIRHVFFILWTQWWRALLVSCTGERPAVGYCLCIDLDDGRHQG